MFTWECPRCGREVDIDEEHCPQCGAHPGAKSQPKSSGRPIRHRALKRPRAGKRRRSRTSSTIGPYQVTILALILVLAVGAALYISRPDLFESRQKLRLENIQEELFITQSRPPGLQDIEVAGIRIWYDRQREFLKVRAVVINHSATARKRLNLVARLRPKGASTTTPPLAEFPIRFENELGSREAREVETKLNSLGHLASFPEWDLLQIQLESQ